MEAVDRTFASALPVSNIEPSGKLHPPPASASASTVAQQEALRTARIRRAAGLALY
jgi:hypothetical protein